MTKEWYRQHGYELSTLIEDAVIERAEREVTEAYVTPIVGDAQVPQAAIERAVGQLAFLLILQRTIFATRAGAKVKMGYNSQDADVWSKLQQESAACHAALENLKRQEGANKNAAVLDICKIYFSTNFLYV